MLQISLKKIINLQDIMFDTCPMRENKYLFGMKIYSWIK